VLRGVEMYKGKPIMYSLGDFIFQNETVLRLPSENYEPYDLGPQAGVSDFNDSRYNNDTSGFPADREIWEAVVAIPTWEGKRLTELALHPISLGFGKGRTERGRPVLADAATGKKILDDIIGRSAPFNTRITIRDGVGYVELGQTSNEE
jgi:poly-gamma-glutamate synthesis protein (capsule biosynthesis protein)